MGGESGALFAFFLILPAFSSNISIKTFHTKCNQNRIVNEDFKILDGGEEPQIAI